MKQIKNGKTSQNFCSKNVTVKQLQFINTLICKKKKNLQLAVCLLKIQSTTQYDDMASSGQAASYLMQVASYLLSFTLFSSKLCKCFI